MDTKTWRRHAAYAAVALLATTAKALAQGGLGGGGGLFNQFGNAGNEFSANAPVVIGAAGLGLGGYLMPMGGWNLYKHFSPRHRAEGSIAAAFGSFVAGFIILGMVAWAALGTTTFTGGAPSAGTGAAVTFQ